MKHPRMTRKPAIWIAVAAFSIVLCCMAVAADLSADSKQAAVDSEQYADFMAGEILDLENLADFVEIQRQYFNRITPPGISWVQPMFPAVAPFDAAYFADSFLNSLLGEDKNSVAVYPLSFSLDSKTRETLVYNAAGKLILTLPAGKDSWATPEIDADPGRVTLQLDLLPVDDVDTYLYVEERIEETMSSASAKSAISGKAARKSLGVSEFGIANIQSQTNGAIRITATNGSGTAEVYAFTVWHTNTVDIVTGTNGVTETNIIWWAASAPYNGVDEAWECRTTNLVFTNGIAIWDDTNVPTNARQRMYSVAPRMDSDEDSLTDGAEFFVYHSSTGTNDTDGDAMLDGWEVLYGLDPLENDSLEDPDQDGIPNVYEQFNNANPTNSDAASVTTLRVDPAESGSNVFANLAAAFDASVAYSIIEVADGIYSGAGINTHLWFPEHPVMLCTENGGTSRKTVFTYDGEWAAFYLDAEQNSHTIIRGISLHLGGKWSQQYGFWLGPGDYYWNQGMGCAPFFDGVSVEMGESTNNVAFLFYGPAPEPTIFNNCVFRGRPGKSVSLRGIYALDGADLEIINCSFLDFPSAPYAYGVQLYSVHLAETGLVEIANCLWDSSFTASNPTPPFVKSVQYAGYSAPYLVHIADSIMPAVPTWFTPDAQTNLYITNALIAMGGHLRTNSPGIDTGGVALTRDDFEGQARDSSPDIGADEYAALGGGDSDGDGLSDSSEVDTYGTNPYRADSDSDNIADGTEAMDGTDPADPWSYRFEVQGSVTNQTGNSALVWLCRRWGAGAWDTNTAAIVTNGAISIDVLAASQSNTLFVGAFCDYNTNGLPDAIEPVYWKAIVATGSLVRTSFLLKDYDADRLDDWQETLCGTDPLSSNDYCFAVSGNLTNLLYLDTYNVCVGISASTNASEMFVVTNVSTDGSFAFPHIHMTNYIANFCPIHFEDANTNGLWDSGELYGLQSPFAFSNRMGHAHQVTLYPRDNDFDDMPDFWEARHSLNWTNQSDCVEDSDADEIYNVLEYQVNLNPWITNGYGNTAIRDAVNSVDTRLAGRIPSQALSIFNDATTNFVRNTNCWAYPYDLTCCSPWNSSGFNEYAGTLISPQHLIFAGHYMPPTNTIFRFVDRENRVYERRLISIKRHPEYSPYPTNYPDIAVGKLDSAITNGISYAKVLSINYTNYLSSGIRLPTLRLDKEEKALVGDLLSIDIPSDGKHLAKFTSPIDATRLNYYESLIPGDSGNPAFLLLSGQPVLLTIWTGGGAGDGTSLVIFTNSINQLMMDLGGEYQLTTFDMSSWFSEITQ